MKRVALSLLGTFLLVASSGCCCGLFHGGYGGGGCSPCGNPCGASYAPASPCGPCGAGGCSPYGAGAYMTGSTMSASRPGSTYAAAPVLAPTTTATLNPLPTY